MRDLFAALHLYFLSPVLTIYFYLLLAYVIMGWLMIANVVDNRNHTVRSIYSFLHSIIEPVAAPIRRFIPPLGGLDLSVLVIALSIPFLRDFAIPRLIMALP